MKRKRNVETSGNAPKKKTISTNDSNNNSGGKTILDFFGKPKVPVKEEKRNKTKSRSISQEKENFEFKPTSKSGLTLVKNPSKQILPGNANNINNLMTTNMFDYKKKILFNEEFVENLKIILEPFLKQTKISLFTQKINENLALDDVLYDNFFNENIENIITKFLLQLNDDFLYVPVSFLNKESKNVDKSKLKLMEGFNESKYINLQYQASNSKEVNFFLNIF